MSQMITQQRPFERITPYDSPAVMLEQILDGEASLRGVGNTFFDNNRLSPEEREGVRARMKAQVGNNRVVGALVDVALNPWVWLMLATSPAGARAIGAGKSAFAPGPKVLAQYVSKHAPALAQIGALSMAQILHWGPGVDALEAVARHTNLKVMELEPVEEAIKGWMERVGVKRLDPKTLDPDQSARLKRAQQVLHASLTGADRDITWKVVTGFKEGAPEIKEWTAKKLLQGVDLEAMLRNEGLVEVRDRMREFYRKRFDDLFTEGGKVSADKVLRQWRGLRNSVTNAEGQGSEVIRQLMGDEVQSLVSSGKITEAGFKELVEGVFSQGVKHDAYLPRNLWERLTPTRTRVRNLSDLGASPSSVLRNEGRPVLHPEDLDSFREVFGSRVTPEFERMYKGQMEAVGRAGKEATASRVLRVDPFESIRRYNNDTARTYAMHVVDAAKDGELAVGQREWAGMARADPKTTLTDSEIPVGTVFADSGKRPAGGFSYADALLDVGASLPEGHYAREALMQVAIPAVQGRQGVNHLASTSAYLTMRQQLQTLGDSWVGKAIEEYGGSWGKGVVKAWKDEAFLDPGVARSQVNAKMSNMAKFLYTTHLGFNLASSAINLTQPLSMAGTWVGARNVVGGYAEGFKGLGKYLSARFSRHGAKPITQVERERLLRESIPEAEFLGLAGPQMEQLDKVSFGKGESFGNESAAEKFMNYAMGLFSSTEIVNKLTVMGAVKGAYRRGERAAEIGSPAFTRDVRNMVRETQFGAHPLNTPTAFMSDKGSVGRLLANPLTRMFLTYPLRTAVGAGYVSRFVGGREGGAKHALHDFVRGMGISAVMYETAKNLVGADLERAGYFAGVTDLVPGFRGGRFDEREGPLPVPPVLDIPFSLVKAIATDDRALLASSFARTIPGGVALSKALGVAPELPRGPAPLQRTFVDWKDRQADGTVPVYRSDGTLISFQHPTTMVLRAVGVPLASPEQEMERVKYLSGQVEEVRRYKREYTGAMVEGRQGDAESIAAEYQRRFKVPLLITRQHLDTARRVRSQPRGERIGQMLPPELRSAYAASQPPRETRRGNFDQEALRRQVEAQNDAQGQQASFAGYEGY